MELFQSDICLLKDKETLFFAAQGEDFDINSFYSEYKIERQLGAGGFGKVLLGVSRVTGEKVAIKATHNEHVDSVKDLDQLYTEAQTLKALKHPNIVKVLNCFVDRKSRQAIMIMEYLEGGELLTILQEKGSYSEEDAVDIFNQLLDAVTYCHRYKVIHRDLKLENIIAASSDGKVFKIVDFGIAGLFAGHKSEVTNAGSLNYMPPELFTKKNVVASPALDVWSLGCILYALVVGKIPFRGETMQEIKQKITNEKYSFPEDMQLSEELLDLLSRMLEKEPENRASVYEISDHPWVCKRKFTEDEKAKVREREEQAALLEAQLLKQKEDESPSRKVKEFGAVKKSFTPSPERARINALGTGSARIPAKGSKDQIINLKESEKDGKESPRKRSVHKNLK